MTIEEVKQRILKTYPLWDETGDSLEDDKWAEFYESVIRDLIADFCEVQNYLVEGFPTEKRELGKTNFDYDEDYFTWQRYEKYIDALCLQKEDVLDLRFFYYKTFWPTQFTTKEALIEEIKFNFENNLYDAEF